MAAEGTYIMVGDCGGTNTRLALWNLPHQFKHLNRGESPPGHIIFEKKYINEQFPDFTSICKKFLSDSPASSSPKTACLACAGPVVLNRVKFTNISAHGWVIDGEVLARETGIQVVTLVNDFTAMGYGLLTLNDNEVHCLNDVPGIVGEPIATIGAGTGLGECYMTKDPSRAQYVCFPTEGGHTDFAPRDELEFELLGFLRAKFAEKKRVSVERIVSGPGTLNIYEFLKYKYPDLVDPLIQERIDAAGSMGGSVIAQHSKTDKLCKQAFEIFFTAYASECGNAMLKYLPFGGFYITGGIASKNLDWIVGNNDFLETMFDKGRVSPALRKIPIYVCKVDDVGERGAHMVAYYDLLKTLNL